MEEEAIKKIIEARNHKLDSQPRPFKLSIEMVIELVKLEMLNQLEADLQESVMQPFHRKNHMLMEPL